jgi:AraC-like DNA-binding protein
VRTDEPLLWLSGAGHETITRHLGYYYDCRFRRDAHLGLQLTLRGEGYYERDGQTTRLQPGMAFFDMLPGDFRYGYPRGATAPYEIVFIDMQGPTALALWKIITAGTGPVVSLGENNPVAPLMLALAHQHRSELLLDRYQTSARVYEVLMVMLSVLNRARLTTSPLVQRALRDIHERGLRRECDVASIAKAVGCTREHLTRAFIAATGLSPGAYLLQHRLRRAQEELRGNDDGLDLIAWRCGFSGANYFCRVFRSRVGITPTEFRSRPWVVRTGDA